MPGNVHDQLAAEKPSLVKRMTGNSSVTGAIMGYLNLFLGVSLEQGKSIRSVRIGEIVESKHDLFQARVTFDALRHAEMWAPPDEFEKYAGSKGLHFARALSTNRSLKLFFEHFVSVIENWAAHEGVSFNGVEVVDPVMTREFILRFKLKRKLAILA